MPPRRSEGARRRARRISVPWEARAKEALDSILLSRAHQIPRAETPSRVTPRLSAIIRRWGATLRCRSGRLWERDAALPRKPRRRVRTRGPGEKEEKNLNAKTERLIKAVDFDRAVPGRRWSPRNIDLARAVLVDGRSQADVAHEAGIGRQRMSQIIAMMRKAIDDAVPRGWRTDTATLPASDWRKVRAMERAARSSLRRKKQHRS